MYRHAHRIEVHAALILQAYEVRKLRRTEMLAFFAAREPTVIGIEARAGSQHLARTLGELGHEVKLLAP